MSVYTTIFVIKGQGLSTLFDYQNLAMEALCGASSLELNKKDGLDAFLGTKC